MNTKKNDLREIDITQIDLEKMKLKTTDLPGLLEYAHSVGGFKIEPTKSGLIKSNALKAMSEQTQMQMERIYRQMKTLADEVNLIKERVHFSELIYQAKINFKPIISGIYYLYENSSNETNTKEWILSLIAPTEWKALPYSMYLAEVQLMADHTWKILEKNPLYEGDLSFV